MGDGMSLVTRVYEVVVAVDEEYLNAFESDPAEREASRKECWEQIEEAIQSGDGYGRNVWTQYRPIKIWRPILIENEEVEHE
jgi:hypothetical protein